MLKRLTYKGTEYEASTPDKTWVPIRTIIKMRVRNRKGSTWTHHWRELAIDGLRFLEIFNRLER